MNHADRLWLRHLVDRYGRLAVEAELRAPAEGSAEGALGTPLCDAADELASLRAQLAEAQAQLAACAATEWHNGDEKPPTAALYLTELSNAEIRVRFYYGDAWGQGLQVVSWAGPIRYPRCTP